MKGIFVRLVVFFLFFQSGSNQISRMLLGSMVFRLVEEIDHQGMSNWNEWSKFASLVYSSSVFLFQVFNVVLVQVCLLLAFVCKVFLVSILCIIFHRAQKEIAFESRFLFSVFFNFLAANFGFLPQLFSLKFSETWFLMRENKTEQNRKKERKKAAEVGKPGSSSSNPPHLFPDLVYRWSNRTHGCNKQKTSFFLESID
jgi:hypothetical protein